jgi:hypothetical protein
MSVSFLRWFSVILDAAEKQTGRGGSMPFMRDCRAIRFFLMALALFGLRALSRRGRSADG